MLMVEQEGLVQIAMALVVAELEHACGPFGVWGIVAGRGPGGNPAPR
jgi:hypothetical protein